MRSSSAKRRDLPFDLQNGVPRYAQLASVLRRRVQDGRWSVGDKIATIEQMEREFGVARVTIRQAIKLLQEEGVLESQQGRGTFVTEAPRSDRWLQLATDWDSLVKPIKGNVPEFLPEEHPPAIAVSEEEGIAADEYVFLKSLQRKDGRPYALARVHLARNVYELAARRFDKEVSLAVLASLDDVRIGHASQTFVIGAADTEAAAHLRIPLGAPIAQAHCAVTDEAGVAIYVGEITYPGDLVRLRIDLAGPRRAPVTALKPKRKGRNDDR